MKQRIIRLLAVSVILSVLCIGLSSCVPSDPFDMYWQYLNGLDSKSDMCMPDQLSMVVAEAHGDTNTGDRQIKWRSYVAGSSAMYEVDVVMNTVAAKYEFTFRCIDMSTMAEAYNGSGWVMASEFDGDGVVTFDGYTGLTINKYNDQIIATGLMSTLVKGMDVLLAKVELSSDDMGFAATSSDAAAGTDDATSEDLGGAFSSARLLYAGQMTLLGMGMVFLVLAILWAVLGIFKVCLYHPEGEKKTAKADEPMPVKTEAPAPVAPADDSDSDNGVLLAVITAAVAAAMEEEGTPSSGFRVVSFKKTTRGPWNG